MKQEDIEKIKFVAKMQNELDKYVYLRKDDKGMYIEYAFIEGAPHDNRCLSWYDSYQEKAYIRNKWTEGLSDTEAKEYLAKLKEKRDKRVGGLYRLSSFTCGYEEDTERTLKKAKNSWEKYKEYHDYEPFVPEDHICKVGCPAKNCRETWSKCWTYEEPVKCACWVLDTPRVPENVNIPIDLAMKLINLDSQ